MACTLPLPRESPASRASAGLLGLPASLRLQGLCPRLALFAQLWDSGLFPDLQAPAQRPPSSRGFPGVSLAGGPFSCSPELPCGTLLAAVRLLLFVPPHPRSRGLRGSRVLICSVLHSSLSVGRRAVPKEGCRGPRARWSCLLILPTAPPRTPLCHDVPTPSPRRREVEGGEHSAGASGTSLPRIPRPLSSSPGPRR